MSNEDLWKEAPEGAEYYNKHKEKFYKGYQGKVYVFYLERWFRTAFDIDYFDLDCFIKRPIPERDQLIDELIEDTGLSPEFRQLAANAIDKGWKK